MPTLSVSPGAYSATVGGMRPHRYSVPHGKPVSALYQMSHWLLYDIYRTLALPLIGDGYDGNILHRRDIQWTNRVYCLGFNLRENENRRQVAHSVSISFIWQHAD